MKNKNLFVVLVLLGLAVGLVVLRFYLWRVTISGYTLPPEATVIVNNGLIFLMVLVLLLMSRKLFFMEKQKKLMEFQELYMGHLQELVRATRMQRHNFVNHLQVVYSLLKTGKTEKAERYIEDFCHDVRISGEIMRIDIPELAALLLVKMGMAVSKNISFQLEVESNLNMINVKPLDLNTIIANLVDNSFETVETLAAERTVVLRLFETTRYFVFQTINPGFIEKEVMARIFEAGFSTKPGDRGLGLASVKSAVERNKGKIVVSSHKHRGTRFTVTFPK